MQKKRAIKAVCFGVVCVAVGIFLYSRMHVDYLTETQKHRSKSTAGAESMEENKEKSPIVFPEKFHRPPHPVQIPAVLPGSFPLRPACPAACLLLLHRWLP